MAGRSLSQVSKSLNYDLLKRDIGTMFDVMKLDKSSLEKFKISLKEEVERQERNHPDVVFLRNEKLRQIKRERRLKEKDQMDKDLDFMIRHMPKASQACRIENILKVSSLAEMPKSYKIKSHYDFNPKD